MRRVLFVEDVERALLVYDVLFATRFPHRQYDPETGCWCYGRATVASFLAHYVLCPRGLGLEWDPLEWPLGELVVADADALTDALVALGAVVVAGSHGATPSHAGYRWICDPHGYLWVIRPPLCLASSACVSDTVAAAGVPGPDRGVVVRPALRTLLADRSWEHNCRLDVPDLETGRRFYLVLAEVFSLSMWVDPETGCTFLASQDDGVVEPLAVLRPGAAIWPGDWRREAPMMTMHLADVRPAVAALTAAGATFHELTPGGGRSPVRDSQVFLRDPFGYVWELDGAGADAGGSDLPWRVCHEGRPSFG